MEDLLTVGAIARRLGVPPHRIQYQILRLSLKSAARAGVLRLFDAQAVEQIGEALRTRKGAGCAN
jgi:hypothetical protein